MLWGTYNTFTGALHEPCLPGYSCTGYISYLSFLLLTSGDHVI